MYVISEGRMEHLNSVEETRQMGALGSWKSDCRRECVLVDVRTRYAAGAG